ncbi:MAG: hypothetical protein FJ225_10840 [Lentisphaerae bacterium]|nr:hypothetical protein [Lentisphaerota bacterium]
MNRRIMSALIIIALAVLVLIFNRGSVTVNLPFIQGSISGMKSLVFLFFMGLGVAIGLLLK